MTPTDTKSETETQKCSECGCDLEEDSDICFECHDDRLHSARANAIQKIAIASGIVSAETHEVADIVCAKLKQLTAAHALLERMHTFMPFPGAVPERYRDECVSVLADYAALKGEGK